MNIRAVKHGCLAIEGRLVPCLCDSESDVHWLRPSIAAAYGDSDSYSCDYYIDTGDTITMSVAVASGGSYHDSERFNRVFDGD